MTRFPPRDRATRLDVSLLGEALEHRLDRDGLSLRAAARTLGLSPSTLTRVRQGHPPDAEAVLLLMNWLRLDPADVLVASGSGRSAARRTRTARASKG